MISYKGPTYLVADISNDARDWRNHPEIFKYCRQHSLLTQTDHHAWLNWLNNNKTNKMFGVAIKKDIKIEMPKTYYDPNNHNWTTTYDFKSDPFLAIGVCGLTNIDWIGRHAEFSLYIAPKYQGKGYAKSALYNLLRHGFEAFNLNKIWGEVFEYNKAGLHLFCDYFHMQKRPGHRQHYFKEGKYIDTFIVDILASEFNKLPCDSRPTFDDADVSLNRVLGA